MRHLLLILLTSITWFQQSDPVIEWLTSLQSMQARLRDKVNSREAEQIANEVRALQAEIAAWATSQTDTISIPAPPDQATSQTLSAHVTGLREVLEQHERKK